MQSLLREILASLRSGDMLLGNTLYASWFLLSHLFRGGADGLLEQHGGRKRGAVFCQGEQLDIDLKTSALIFGPFSPRLAFFTPSKSDLATLLRPIDF